MKASAFKSFFLSVLAIAFVAAFAYGWPRFLAARLGENSPWISYLYTYGLGLAVFLLSLVWIFSRKGVDPERRREERLWLIAVACGLAFMCSFHGLWIFLATQFPVKS